MQSRNPDQMPRIQIPIRINHSLHQRFTKISNKTKIPMSTLARDAIERHLADIEYRGISAVLDDMCEV